MTNLSDIAALNAELDKSMIRFGSYHAKMRLSRDFYKNSAFYEKQAGDVRNKNDPYENMLALFADTNIGYTSSFPTIKVPTTGSAPEVRQAASMREKILYATWLKSGGKMLQKKWAYDGTVFSAAVAETTMNIKTRCVQVRRYDPRRVFWQISNDNEPRLIAFWAVYSITADEAWNRYGVRPTRDLISAEAQTKNAFHNIDGREWFTMAIRWDEKTRVAWIGDKLIEEPHNHLMGEIPIDICSPIEDADEEGLFPGFYLDPLVPLQAELNDAVQRRSRIVKRMSSPVVWVRGIGGGHRLEDLKKELAKPGGGTIGLSSQGEAGLLQLNDTKMIDNHQDRLLTAMMRLSGYGNASFGESVGANTSGDALGMYFNATQRKIEHQNISWISFYESINAKILKCYAQFLKTGEQVSLDGYSPAGTLLPVTDDEGNTAMQYQRGLYSVAFTKDTIGDNYISVVQPKAPTPKNEIEMRRQAMDGVNQKFYSRTTAYEEFGILSPEDELELLKQEQSEPLLNPEGTSQILQAQQPQVPSGGPPPQLPAPQPQPVGAGNGYA
jgi:hypothetical protein